MKIVVATLMLFSAITNFCAAKDQSKTTNAYRMEFLDTNDKPIATAIIWTPKFKFKVRPFYNAKCKLKLLESTSKDKAIVKFNEMMPKRENIEVEIQSYDNSSIDTPPEETPTRLCVNFRPRGHDYNVKVTIDSTKRGLEASWYLELYSGGTGGGDVKITRIFAEQVADGKPPEAPQPPP